MKYKHYSPNCKTALFNFDELEKAFEEYKKQTEKGIAVCILCDNGTAERIVGAEILNLGKTEAEIAANLYS